MKKTLRRFSPEKVGYLCAATIGLFGGAFLVAAFIRITDRNPFICKTTVMRSGGKRRDFEGGKSTELQLNAIFHYATSKIVPQQTSEEIRVSFDVLKAISPCNFLVFGLGYDSIMWASLNPNGTTLFLEETESWVHDVLKDAPYLRAHTVKYRTKLSEADELLTLYKKEPDCWPDKSFIRGNKKCKLALNMLPEEVYNTEWDMIMIDAPRGYFAEAPGRMAAIYSAAVMARNRKRSGVTHVFLHDVERKVENMYSNKFLCKKNMVKEVGKLRYYVIHPTNDRKQDFC